MPVIGPLIAWLSGQSQALRGAAAQPVSTCANLAEYQAAIDAGGTRARLLLRVSYPFPTACTVVLGGTIGTGQPNDTTFPRLYARPPQPGEVFDPQYTLYLGAYWVEWMCGGAVQSALLDLGAGALSLPAVDQVTVKYILLFPSAAPPEAATKLTAQVLPYASPSAQATCTAVPIDVAPGVPANLAVRQQWAQSWRVATSAPQLRTDIPIASGPVVVSIGDTVPGATHPTGEQVRFGDGGIGAPAAGCAWVSTGGISNQTGTYIAHAVGGVTTRCKLIEQVRVG